MPQQICPSPESLRDFALGCSEGVEFETVATHVEHCPTCLHRLELLDKSGDPLLIQLQKLPAVTVSDISDVEHLWANTVLSAVAASGPVRIAADAGTGLARRLLEGPVYLDRFELRSELGVGSFGYVFKAWDPRLERVVALKLQRAGNFASAEDVERFLREARSAAQLKHPSIVSLYETGQTEDGVWFLVCEFIDGHTLETYLRDHSEGLALKEAASIARELAAALHYAHEHGVIHRDVKPGNIILDSMGRAHLMDFGLAKRDSGDQTMTSDGRVLGTPAYMSPEQAAGASHQVDARSDIYSLGVVLYEMIAGQRPFRGERRELLTQVMDDDPQPPRRIRPHIPRDLEIICLQAMHKSPSRRYQSCREMEADLWRFLDGRSALARPPGSVERTLRWCRRYPLAVSVFFAVVFGSIAGLWYLSSLSEYFVRQTALESARQENKMLDEVWRFYSERIEEINPKASGVAITENYRTIHPSLPLPATFSIDLGERIGRNQHCRDSVSSKAARTSTLTEPSKHEFSGGSTSRSLLNEARVADAEAWERLVRLYTPLVASWCRRWGVVEQDIVDILQEVFSAVAVHLDRFRKDRPGDTFRGWLMVIARSKAMDYFKRRNHEPAGVGGSEASIRMKDIRDPSTDANISVEMTNTDDDIVFNDVLLRALESIQGEFHERTWLAFWNVVVEGRSANDVAADLSMKPGTVRVSKSRVLLRLRLELGDFRQ